MTVAKMEILASLRNKILLTMSVILWLLLLVSFFGGYRNYQTNLNNRLNSQKNIDQAWEHQTRNPHAAAHWGTYLFKPYPFISIYEAGLSNYTGNYYRVEAHKQHQVNAVNLEDKEAFMRMSDLTVAILFQLLMPLLIIMLCFSTITKERETKTFLLLTVQGMNSKQLIWGKFMGNYTITLLLTMPVFIIMFAGLLFDTDNEVQVARLLLFFLTYMVYFFVLVAIVVLISSFSRSSRSSLINCLCLWIAFIILLPKVISGLADRTYRLPFSYQFEHDVNESFNKGMGNDGDYVERSNAYLKTFLKKYNVDSISQLPKNVAFGLDLLNSERYNNMVYQYYSSRLEFKISQQQRLLDIAGFVNPFMAVRQLSMGFAGTDFQHHMDFYNHAREFRNNFNEKLNKRVLEFGNEHKSGFFKEGETFYNRMDKFHYSFPPVKWVLQSHHMAVFSLLLWIALIVLLLNISHRIAFRII